MGLQTQSTDQDLSPIYIEPDLHWIKKKNVMLVSQHDRATTIRGGDNNIDGKRPEVLIHWELDDLRQQVAIIKEWRAGETRAWDTA